MEQKFTEFRESERPLKYEMGVNLKVLFVRIIPFYFKKYFTYPVDSTTSGNQEKLKGIFPVREKSGNLAIFQKIREF